MEELRFTFLFLLVSMSLMMGTALVRRNTEPLNIGFIISLPFDISNTLRAPMGGPLSLILGAGLALIMFFGMLATPLYYIFGIPPRPYHIRDAVTNATLNTDFFSRRSFDDSPPPFLTKHSENDTSVVPYPKFLESAFLLIPIDDRECQLLMLCHAHGFLRWLPENTLKFYKFFSRKMTKFKRAEEEAVIIGLEDQGECSKVFDKCGLDIVRIGKMTFNHVVTHFLN